MRLLLCFLLLCFTHTNLWLKAPQPLQEAQCPSIIVSCSDTEEYEGALTFTAKVESIESKVKLNYKWTISAGTITEGQGTASIKVDTNGVRSGGTTATVEVEGLDSSCKNMASCSTAIIYDPAARL